MFAARADVHRARVSVAPSPRDRRARVVDVFSLIPIVHAVRALAALARGRRSSPHRARRPPARRVVASRRARAFGAGATARIAELGTVAGLEAGGPTQLAAAFVQRIRELNAEMQIPKSAKGLTAKDVDTVATRALAEAHGSQHGFGLAYAIDLGYPVPKYMTHADCAAIVRKIVP